MSEVTQDNYKNLSDAEILELAGPYGPALIGQELYDKAQEIRAQTGDGKFGPAIMDPDYDKKQKALKKSAAATAGASTADDSPPPDLSDPWSTVTLSGAKQLAMDAGVSYVPGTKKAALIEALKTAGVTPPAAPPKE
jgi:hypothetical protein